MSTFARHRFGPRGDWCRLPGRRAPRLPEKWDLFSVVWLAICVALVGICSSARAEGGSKSTRSAALRLSWASLSFAEFSAGVPQGSALSAGIQRAVLLRFSGSPYVATPYPRFGVGGALYEEYKLGAEPSERATFLPIYLEFVPYLRCREFSGHRILSEQRGTDWLRIEYDPNSTETRYLARIMVTSFVGGSAWCIQKVERLDSFGNVQQAPSKAFTFGKWYLSSGFRAAYFFKASDLMAERYIWSFAASAGLVTMDRPNLGVIDTQPFLSLSFGVGPTMLGRGAYGNDPIQ